METGQRAGNSSSRPFHNVDEICIPGDDLCWRTRRAAASARGFGGTRASKRTIDATALSALLDATAGRIDKAKKSVRSLDKAQLSPRVASGQAGSVGSAGRTRGVVGCFEGV